MLREYIENNISLSIIIVSFNTCFMTRDCLFSLKSELNLTRILAEVIVVDNASTDGTIEMIKEEFPEIKLLQLKKNFGFGAANNRGVELSLGKYILLLNSDTIVKPNALKHLFLFANKHLDIIGVAPKLLNSDGSLQKNCWRFPTLFNQLCESLGLLRLLGRPSNYLTYQYNKQMKVDFATGACLLIPRTEFQRVNGFDELFFMYAEETDLCRRMKQKDKFVYYIPEAEVIHFGSGSQITPGKRLEQFCSSQNKYYFKHYGKLGLYSYRSIFVFRCLIRVIFWGLFLLLRPNLKEKVQPKVDVNKWMLFWQLHWKFN